MITLAVLALATTLILPGLTSGMRSAARHAAALELDQQVLALRREAISTGRTLVIGGDPAAMEREGDTAADLRLPEGWAYRTDAPIAFSPDGGCGEGVVELVKQGRIDQRFAITMPACRPQPA